MRTKRLHYLKKHIEQDKRRRHGEEDVRTEEEYRCPKCGSDDVEMTLIGWGPPRPEFNPNRYWCTTCRATGKYGEDYIAARDGAGLPWEE